jgi:hypothetical protein
LGLVGRIQSPWIGAWFFRHCLFIGPIQQRLQTRLGLASTGNRCASVAHRTSVVPACPEHQENLFMPRVVMHTAEIAQEYFAAFKRKDAEEIAKLLHPEVHLKSPIADFTGREPFLAMCRKIFPQLEDLVVRAEFASETEVVTIYDFVLKQPIGRTRTANLMIFEDGLIRSVELFFDARPFEKPIDQGRLGT